ncbi:MAG: RidA family protein [Gammaproteobacteria bacterium]
MNSPRVCITTDQAPQAIGPYSQAVRSGNMLFISGQIGLVPETGKLQPGFEAQAKQVLANLAAICNHAGTSLQQAIKLTVYLTDLNQFKIINELMSTCFDAQTGYPARATIEVSALPLEAVIEIDAVVHID